ncbi:sugar-transfer associated ATP-grasp domain-containing protein [uncultured Roseobacter sp.]|uniref:sugar-transfer associated ATP-grasp domain-containing protein n=1 Tax=uncultured Roseobacter sp. TaxID=114847 RepID=UPI00261918B4|nr:sugar-transfer associated ATP-grasp domain-containing protein [uncultured Roseobacter sp.]
MNTATQAGANLLEKTDGAAKPPAPVILRVAKEFGVGPARQLREMLSLRFGPGRLTSQEYYDQGLFDPALTSAEKREFVGVATSKALNTRLSPPEVVQTGSFVGHKVLFSALMRQLGLAVPETLAVVSRTGSFGNTPMLRDAAGVSAFLSDASAYPLFGKPLGGSLSVGSVLLRSFDAETGYLTLGNGKTTSLSDFSAEVTDKYAGGYLFQPALTPHEEMSAITGETTGCLRIVTAMTGPVPQTVYGLWKIPAPQAMSDNFWQAGSMLAHIETETGTVTGCRSGSGPDIGRPDVSPRTGARVTGLTIPHWQAARELAQQAHAVLPDYGVCGWDIAITPDGPVIVECNDSPFHTLWQTATGRGVMNAEFAAVWQAVEARQAERLARIRASK